MQVRLAVLLPVLCLIREISIVVWGSVELLGLWQRLCQCQLQHQLQSKAAQQYVVVTSMFFLADGRQYALQSQHRGVYRLEQVF